jgi:hypothetical protein
LLRVENPNPAGTACMENLMIHQVVFVLIAGVTERGK